MDRHRGCRRLRGGSQSRRRTAPLLGHSRATRPGEAAAGPPCGGRTGCRPALRRAPRDAWQLSSSVCAATAGWRGLEGGRQGRTPSPGSVWPSDARLACTDERVAMSGARSTARKSDHAGSSFRVDVPLQLCCAGGRARPPAGRPLINPTGQQPWGRLDLSVISSSMFACQGTVA